MASAAMEMAKRLGRLINFQTVFFAGVIVFTLWLVLLPLIFLIWNSFHMAASPLEAAPLGMKNYITAYSSPATYKMLLNTTWFAFGSVCIGLSLGVMFAWLLERTNVPFKNVLYALIPLPMVIPGMLAAIAWILILSPRIGIINVGLIKLLGLEKAPFNIYTIGGMFFVQGLRMVPTMFLMMVGAFRSMDPSLEEASAISGTGTLTTLRRITVPLMLPAILSAAIYSFIAAFEAFEVPGVIGLTAGIHVFSTRIYMASRAVPANYALASAFASTFVVLSIILMLVYQRLTRKAERFATITGKGYRPRLIDIGPWRYVALFIVCVYIFLDLILPLVILLWGSFQPYYQVPTIEGLKKVSLAAYRSAYAYPQITLAFKNTFYVMVGSSTAAVILGTLIAWIVVRTRMPARHAFDTLTFLPHGMPSIVIGLALLLVYLRLDFIPLYGTLWIIIIAFLTRYMTFGVRTMNAAMHQIHKELEEAAWVSGATWWTMLTRITVPLLIPSILSVWVWTAMHAIRELSAAIMLSSPKTTVISVVIWDLWEQGLLPESCVLGVVLIFIMAVIMILGRVYGFRLGRGGGL